MPTQTLPTYQTLFGTDNYYTVPDERSVLSPGAYLVELLKLVDNNITVSTGGVPLSKRRPDIYTLPLNAANTDNELPKLDIVNQVLQDYLNGGNSDANYPFSLPYNANLQAVRTYLAQNTMTLQGLWEELNPASTDTTVQQDIQLETLGITANQWTLYTTPVVSGSLWKYYGFPSGTSDSDVVAALGSIPTFLAQTGLTRDQLTALVNQDLSQEEIANKVQGSLYINSLNTTSPIQIQGQTLKNLTATNCDLLMRFIRLAQAIGWSFADLDWAIRTITQISLPFLAWIQEQKKKGLSVNQSCAIMGKIKTVGKESGTTFYESIFNNTNTPSKSHFIHPPTYPGPTWNVPQPGTADNQTPTDELIEHSLTIAFQITSKDLAFIANLIVPSSSVPPNSLMVNLDTLAVLYRLSLLPQLTGGKSIADVFRACSIIDATLDGETPTIEKNLIPPSQFYPIVTGALSSLQRLFSWIASSPISLGQLEFITLGTSKTPAIQNAIVGTNAAQNFQTQLQASLSKELLTADVLYATLNDNMLQVATQVFNNLPQLDQKELRKSHSTIIRESAKNAFNTLYSALTQNNIISSQGIVIVKEPDVTTFVKNIKNNIKKYYRAHLPSPEIPLQEVSVEDATDNNQDIPSAQNLQNLKKQIVDSIQKYNTKQQNILANQLAGLYHSSSAITTILQRWADNNLTMIEYGIK